MISVSLFGVYSANDSHQWNYIYSQIRCGKGSNEVVLLLEIFAEMKKIHNKKKGGNATWAIYADNCTGQNKNNTLIDYLLFLVDTGSLKEARLNFLLMRA